MSSIMKQQEQLGEKNAISFTHSILNSLNLNFLRKPSQSSSRKPPIITHTPAEPFTITSQLSLQDLETGVEEADVTNSMTVNSLLVANGVTSRSRGRNAIYPCAWTSQPSM